MGRLVAIDTSVLIYLLEEHPEHARKARRLFECFEKGSLKGIFSIVGMIELLTGVKKKGRKDLAQDYKILLSRLSNFDIYSIDEDIVDIASDLRVSYGVRTPDAIHVATAMAKDATMFITNDRSLKKIKEMKVVSLGDLNV